MKFVSLFSGAMGLDLGLERAGLDCAVCVEIDPEAVATIRHNRPDLPVIDSSIADIDGRELRKKGRFGNRRISLVAGGPPLSIVQRFLEIAWV